MILNEDYGRFQNVDASGFNLLDREMAQIDGLDRRAFRSWFKLRK
jgi:hypothetical protein